MKTTFIKTKLLVLTTAISLFSLGPRVGTANELFNGNLDLTEISSQINATPTGWIVESENVSSGQNSDGCSSEPWCNVVELDGKGLFFKPFGGSAPDPEWAPFGDELSVRFYQDVGGAAGTKYTLSAFATGEPNFCAFFNTNTPAPKVYLVIIFLNAGNNVLASNVFDMVAGGMPKTGPGGMAGSLMTTPQFTAPANTTTVRAGVFMLNAYGTTGAQSFFVDGLDLAFEAPPGAPVFTLQPTNTTVAPGGTAILTSDISNAAGVTFQWQFYGTNISNGGKYSGATTKTLTIANVSATEVGRYRVRASNASGGAVSREGTLAAVAAYFFPVISITGKINDQYRVDWSPSLPPPTWTPLSTNKLTTVPYNVTDTSSPGNNSRFYRAVKIN